MIAAPSSPPPAARDRDRAAVALAGGDPTAALELADRAIAAGQAWAAGLMVFE